MYLVKSLKRMQRMNTIVESRRKNAEREKIGGGKEKDREILHVAVKRQDTSPLPGVRL